MCSWRLSWCLLGGVSISLLPSMSQGTSLWRWSTSRWSTTSRIRLPASSSKHASWWTHSSPTVVTESFVRVGNSTRDLSNFCVILISFRQSGTSTAVRVCANDQQYQSKTSRWYQRWLKKILEYSQSFSLLVREEHGPVTQICIASARNVFGFSDSKIHPRRDPIFFSTISWMGRYG